jgi:L-arabonate dehydrase
MRPTAMLFRNLASMDVEESIRANPLDGVVLLMGCDKTTPALLMGAASCDLPTIGVSGGPHAARQVSAARIIGSGTNIVWKMSEQVRAGEMTLEEFTRPRAACTAPSRPLHDHGHGLDHGLDGRGAGHVAARQRRHPAVDARRNESRA